MIKKTEVITFRTDTETKENLTKIANDKDWSVAQVVDKICKQHFTEKTNLQISISTEIDEEIITTLKERKWNIGDLVDIFIESLTPEIAESIAFAVDSGEEEMGITLKLSE